MDALPPDPYIALGLAKDATAAAIKTQYRKLALKFHPDKVQDDAQKQAAADQFHKIQTAYEIVGDDDRRGRYDAQCKLSELRKDVMERSGGRGVDVRTAAMRVPTESARGGEFYARGPDRTRVSPTYEERRPSYVQEDYFDLPPRAASRKEADYERPSKRASPRDDREKTRSTTKATKENDRSSRKEKSRRTEKDVRRDRDRKAAYATVEEDTASDSDEYERIQRRMAAEHEAARARDARDAYRASMQRAKEEAEAGMYSDPRTQKMFSQAGDAREYIQRSMQTTRDQAETEQRPQSARQASSKDRLETIKRSDGRPITIRRGSGRPRTTGRDADEPRERKSSSREQIEVVEEPEEAPRRPPTLNQTKSSPADIRPPTFERQRSYSVQVDADETPKPQMKRSETMPLHSSPHVREREGRRKEGSKLRTEAKEAYPTPEASPEPPQSRKYTYGQQYADDMEYATPDGYRTELREPDGRTETREPTKTTTRRQFTRSPSPIKESRERSRNTSSKQPPQPQRTTSTQYVYSNAGQEAYSRPAVSRENSSRGQLYGEIPKDTTSTRSTPRQHSSKYSPPPEDVKYAKYDAPSMQSGFNTAYNTSSKQHRRTAAESRPSYGRSSSSRHAVYAN